jgi:hypothetical protein
MVQLIAARAACTAASRKRKLKAPKLMLKVYGGKLFRDGIAVKTKIEPPRKAA